jgi:hypothetical protein
MSDNDLQSVIQQYYDASISSRMLPSMVLPGSAPATVYKDQVEAMVARICRYGALDGADTGSTVINILLPRGVVLVKEACTSLALVFREVDLADGSGAVPVQLMWSNKTSTPAIRLA